MRKITPALATALALAVTSGCAEKRINIAQVDTARIKLAQIDTLSNVLQDYQNRQELIERGQIWETQRQLQYQRDWDELNESFYRWERARLHQRDHND